MWIGTRPLHSWNLIVNGSPATGWDGDVPTMTVFVLTNVLADAEVLEKPSTTANATRITAAAAKATLPLDMNSPSRLGMAASGTRPASRARTRFSNRRMVSHFAT